MYIALEGTRTCNLGFADDIYFIGGGEQITE